MGKLEELNKYLEKYKLSGKRCPYMMGYNSKKDRVILLGVDVLQVEKDGVVTIEIPECVDEINCQNLLRLSDDFPGFQDDYAGKIVYIKLIGNGKALYGKLDDILCLTVVDCEDMKERTGDRYKLDYVQILEIHNLDFCNIQSIRFMASPAKFGAVNYAGHLNELRLINCKGLRTLPSLKYYSLIRNGTPDFDWSRIRFKGTDELDGTFSYDTELTKENLDKSGILKVLHPVAMVNTFFGCKSLKEIPDMDFSVCERLSGTFSSSGLCGDLEISDIGYVLKIYDLRDVFYNTNIESANMHDIEFRADDKKEFTAWGIFDDSKVKKVRLHNIKIDGYDEVCLSGLFENMPNVEEIEFSNIDFGNANVNVDKMFMNLPELKKVTIDGLRCNSLYVMQQSFLGSTSIDQIMFNCSELKSLEVSGINANEVNDTRKANEISKYLVGYCGKIDRVDELAKFVQVR